MRNVGRCRSPVGRPLRVICGQRTYFRAGAEALAVVRIIDVGNLGLFVVTFLAAILHADGRHDARWVVLLTLGSGGRRRDRGYSGAARAESPRPEVRGQRRLGAQRAARRVAPSMDVLAGIAEEVDEILVTENQDWFQLMRSRPPELLLGGEGTPDGRLRSEGRGAHRLNPDLAVSRRSILAGELSGGRRGHGAHPNLRQLPPRGQRRTRRSAVRRSCPLIRPRPRVHGRRRDRARRDFAGSDRGFARATWWWRSSAGRGSRRRPGPIGGVSRIPRTTYGSRSNPRSTTACASFRSWCKGPRCPLPTSCRTACGDWPGSRRSR